MKLMIGDYIVEVKARHKYETRNSTETTKAFLNEISIWSGEAAKYEQTLQYGGLAKSYNKCSDDIYNALKTLGYYNR